MTRNETTTDILNEMIWYGCPLERTAYLAYMVWSSGRVAEGHRSGLFGGVRKPKLDPSAIEENLENHVRGYAG
jgi:hypothetical protein